MSKSETKRELFSEAEVLDMLGVSRPTLQRWRDRGLLGFLKIGTRRRYTRAHIENFKNKFDINGTDLD